MSGDVVTEPVFASIPRPNNFDLPLTLGYRVWGVAVWLVAGLSFVP